MSKIIAVQLVLFLCCKLFLTVKTVELDEIINVLEGTITGALEEIAGEPVVPENVTYYLFNQRHPKKFVKLNPSGDTSALNKAWTTKIVFVVHGWTESRSVDWYRDLKNALLKKDPNFLVVQVDWSGPAAQQYSLSSAATELVGKFLGAFIVDLHKKHQISLDKFHIIGHSLGGQVAGFAGKQVFNQTGEKISKITALDAAGVLFETKPLDERLNDHDAKIVVAIHTNGGRLGFLDPIGTVDIFVNGGTEQPGCAINANPLNLVAVVADYTCSHHRSYELFVKSVSKPGDFVTKSCIVESKEFDGKSTVSLGDLNIKQSGNFCLETDAK